MTRSGSTMRSRILHLAVHRVLLDDHFQGLGDLLRGLVELELRGVLGLEVGHEFVDECAHAVPSTRRYGSRYTSGPATPRAAVDGAARGRQGGAPRVYALVHHPAAAIRAKPGGRTWAKWYTVAQCGVRPAAGRPGRRPRPPDPASRRSARAPHVLVHEVQERPIVLAGRPDKLTMGLRAPIVRSTAHESNTRAPPVRRRPRRHGRRAAGTSPRKESRAWLSRRPRSSSRASPTCTCRSTSSAKRWTTTSTTPSSAPASTASP